MCVCELCRSPFSGEDQQRQHGVSGFCSIGCSIRAKTPRPHGPGRPRVDQGNRPPQRYKRSDGYIAIYVGKKYSSNGYALEHRVIAAEKYGRPIEKHEHVHHLNSVRDDNRPENLEILDRGAHGRISNQQRMILNRQMRDENERLRSELARYKKQYGPLAQLSLLLENIQTCRCEQCGKEYLPARSAHERKSRYCSHACRLDAMHVKGKAFHASRRAEPLTCQQCGTTFQANGQRHQTAKYCSIACKAEAQRAAIVEKRCERCGTMFHRRYASEIANARYCSRRCSLEVGTEVRLAGYIAPEARMCGWCAQSYLPRFQAEETASRYCSRDCWRLDTKERWRGDGNPQRKVG